MDRLLRSSDEEPLQCSVKSRSSHVGYTEYGVCEVHRNPYGVKRIPKEFLFAAHGLRAQTLPKDQVESYRRYKTSGFLSRIESSFLFLDEGIAGVVPGRWRVSCVRAGSMRSDTPSEEVYTWDVELERLGS